MDEDVPKTLCQLQTSLSIQVENPVLWDHETPYLYELTTILKKNDTVIDERTDKVGFRNIKFDAKKGFLINGKHVKLNGVCLHHDGGCVGAAVPPEIWRRRLEKLKDMGVNSVRCSHNPPDEALLDLCDELGFYVMDEAFDEWRLMKAKEIGSNTHESHGYSMYFDACHEWDLKTMLYRDRNHPGIVLWSIGNEIPEEVVVGGEELAVELSGYCHTIDPTRKVTLAHDQIAAEPYSARDAFLAGAVAVGAKVEIETMPGYLPTIPVDAPEDLVEAAKLAAGDKYNVNVVDATSTPSGGSTDVGDVQHLQPVFTFNTGGAVGSGLHSVDFDVNDEELAYIVTAKIFALTAYRLLKGGAVAAKKLVDDYKPIFTKQEYIDFMESMISKKTGGAPVFEEE